MEKHNFKLKGPRNKYLKTFTLIFLLFATNIGVNFQDILDGRPEMFDITSILILLIIGIVLLVKYNSVVGTIDPIQWHFYPTQPLGKEFKSYKDILLINDQIREIDIEIQKEKERKIDISLKFLDNGKEIEVILKYDFFDNFRLLNYLVTEGDRRLSENAKSYIYTST